jgi:hypothetical protein
MNDCCLTPSEQLSSISWRENVTFGEIMLMSVLYHTNTLIFLHNLVRVEKLTNVHARPERKDNSGRDWTSMSRSQEIHSQLTSSVKILQAFPQANVTYTDIDYSV